MNGRLLEMQFVWADKSKTNKTNKYLNKLFSCFINKSSYFKNCIFRDVFAETVTVLVCLLPA